MIFATVGTQLPFDRLIRTLDQWAKDRGQADAFAQIGPDGAAPATIEFTRTMEPAEFQAKLEQADLIVAHAGMGTILSALELGKRVIVMPRLAELGEHRNDHQLATAKKLGDAGLVQVARDAAQLVELLDAAGTLATADVISPYASEPLLAAVRQFIHGQSQTTELAGAEVINA